MKSTLKLNAIKQSYPNDKLLQKYCDEVIEELERLEQCSCLQQEDYSFEGMVNEGDL